MKSDFSFLYRKKKYDSVNIHETNLSRVLGLVDITALGVSCTLGNGIYVLAGEVIANYAGPSIVLSFIIAGLATGLAGLVLDIVIFIRLHLNNTNISFHRHLLCRIWRARSTQRFSLYLHLRYDWRIYRVYLGLGFNLRVCDWRIQWCFSVESLH